MALLLLPTQIRSGGATRGIAALISGGRHRHHRAHRHPAKVAASRRPGIGERGKAEHGIQRRARSSAAPAPMPCRARRSAARRRRSMPRCRPATPAGSACAAAAARWWRGQNLGFAEHAVDQRHRDRGHAGTLQQDIAHRNLHTLVYGDVGPALAPVNTLVYGGMSQARHDRSTFRKRLARPGAESPGAARFHGAEGRAAGEGDGRLARQFLLAFCRYRRVPRRDPEALARGRRRTGHCRARS